MGRKPNLTPEQVEEARTLFLSPEWTVTALARSFGVHVGTMRAALDRKGAYRRQEPSRPGEKQ